MLHNPDTASHSLNVWAGPPGKGVQDSTYPDPSKDPPSRKILRSHLLIQEQTDIPGVRQLRVHTTVRLCHYHCHCS